MTLLLKQIYGFLKLLNSDTGTNQIAAGLACGIALGFSPILSLQGLLILVIILFFRVQAGAAFIAAFFFKFVAWFLDPAFHSLGTRILEAENLRPIFVTLYNLPIIPFTRFNNSIVMGAGMVSFILFIPVFFLSRYLVVQYRKQLLERFKNTKLWKMIHATSLYQWYLKYEDLYG